MVIDELAVHEVPNPVVFVANSLSLLKGMGSSERHLK